MRNSKKRWLRVLPNMVCLTLIFVMLFHVSVTTNSLPLSEAESSEPKDAVVLRLLDEAPGPGNCSLRRRHSPSVMAAKPKTKPHFLQRQRRTHQRPPTSSSAIRR